MNSKHTIFAILILVFRLSIFGCQMGGAPKTIATPAPTAPPLAGRILLLQNGEGNTMTLLEFKEGLQAPQTLWTDIPGRLPESSEALQPIIVASPNHHVAMLMNSHSAITILGLTDGTSTTIGMPERKYSSESYDIAGSFSPDSRHLAYALTGWESSHSGLYLYDLDDNVLHLTDLRRGSDQELPTLWLISYQTNRQRINDEPPTISWSPDGKEIVCLSGQELDVRSIQGLSQRTRLENFDGYLVDWTP